MVVNLPQNVIPVLIALKGLKNVYASCPHVFIDIPYRWNFALSIGLGHKVAKAGAWCGIFDIGVGNWEEPADGTEVLDIVGSEQLC